MPLVAITDTLDGDVEWWQVDLGASNVVGSVELTNRGDCCVDRLVGAEVFVSATTDYTAGAVSCGSVADPDTLIAIRCPAGAAGQYITVTTANQHRKETRDLL